MDHFEIAKRGEEAPLIETTFQRRLADEQLLHEHEQHLEVELNTERHDGDVHEKSISNRI
ncbi:Proteasome component (PCI) domain-containing protein [Artemisia annua]|uniref:Proteasome component (PCI) domain-containing protein n=1 Tax=Artemisia annua TaxID=35608 RepID=A0A2U1KDY6_ARTAN|nr:Proteasome component (PCI) domain-containing protein [Artemisia annua]